MFGHLAPWVIQPEPETVVVRDDKAINILQERLRNLQKTNQENVNDYNEMVKIAHENFIKSEAKTATLNEVAETYNIDKDAIFHLYKKNKNQMYDFYEEKWDTDIERHDPKRF